MSGNIHTGIKLYLLLLELDAELFTGKLFMKEVNGVIMAQTKPLFASMSGRVPQAQLKAPG